MEVGIFLAAYFLKYECWACPLPNLADSRYSCVQELSIFLKNFKFAALFLRLGEWLPQILPQKDKQTDIGNDEHAQIESQFDIDWEHIHFTVSVKFSHSYCTNILIKLIYSDSSAVGTKTYLFRSGYLLFRKFVCFCFSVYFENIFSSHIAVSMIFYLSPFFFTNSKQVVYSSY